MPTPDPEFDLPLYSDAQRYDSEHWWKTDDLQFWHKMAARYGPKVLELGAGTGRLAVEVLEAGCDYTGLEISQAFLDKSETKLAEYDGKYNLLRGDMRDFDLEQKYDLIFVGFNSFLHLLKDADAAATLSSVHKHCHHDTRFIIDIFVPDPIFLYRPDGHRIETMTYYDPDNGERVGVQETNDYDSETGLNRIKWYYSTKQRKDFLTYDFTMRMYYPDTIDRLFHEAGFQIMEKWGDYVGTAFGPESHIQLYIAKAIL